MGKGVKPITDNLAVELSGDRPNAKSQIRESVRHSAKQKLSTAPARLRKVTNRIRIELTFGALTLRELAGRCGITGTKATEKLIPFVWQMEHRTKELVKLKGAPNRYALKRQHTGLQAWR